MFYMKPSYQVVLSAAVLLSWKLLTDDRGLLAFVLFTSVVMMVLNLEVKDIENLSSIKVDCIDFIYWSVFSLSSG